MHSLSKEKIELQFSLHTPNCVDTIGEKNEDELFKKASVATIIRINNHKPPDLLFIKRAERIDDPWSGHIAFPGGKVDEEKNEDWLTAAYREVFEEIGVNLEESASLIGALNDIKTQKHGKMYPMVIRPFVFILEKDIMFSINTEVDECFWIPLTHIVSKESHKHFEYSWQGNIVTLPCIYYNNYKIWGITHLMISNFLEILK